VILILPSYKQKSVNETTLAGMSNPMKVNRDMRYRRGVASRAIAAILGGYVLAALSTALLALALPMPRVDAVMTATLLSFTVYTCAAIWVFAARDALRAWLGVGVPVLVMGLGLSLLRSAA
jgi:apolipoprotein N-acyltransferase